MLDIILPTVLVSFTGYLFWYLTSAKRDVPITVNEAEIQWKIHKERTNCAGNNWHPIARRGSRVSGFKCECGYRYAQKRLLVSSLPKAND